MEFIQIRPSLPRVNILELVSATFYSAGCSACRPSNSIRALKGKCWKWLKLMLSLKLQWMKFVYYSHPHSQAWIGHLAALYVCMYVCVCMSAFWKTLDIISSPKLGRWMVNDNSWSLILFEVKRSNAKVGMSLHSSECQSSVVIRVQTVRSAKWFYIRLYTEYNAVTAICTSL